MRILFVDDQMLILNAIRKMAKLRRAQHEVVTATTGEAACEEIARGQRFDVIVLDHQMPGLHGTELIERLRKMTPGTPIVALTGSKWEALSAGYDQIFEKPIPPEELIDKLKELLNGGWPHA